jgi:polysaccharide biosynthesis protein PslG
MHRRQLMLACAAALLVVLVVVVVLLATGSSGTRRAAAGSTGTVGAPRAVSGEVVGVTLSGPALTANVNLGQQLDAAVGAGVESLRVAVNWSALQPYEHWSEVPAAQRGEFSQTPGAPTRFVDLDRIVAGAAARRLSLLPVVEYTPAWDALRPGELGSPPRSTQPYASFVSALVKRYGLNGTFWAAHREIRPVPVRMWQIWNEPHFVSYWSEQPFARSYVKLLAAAHTAIKAADPGAKVVLAGFAEFSWQYLAQIYAVQGARELFDVVAIHPYTADPPGVIIILQRVRAIMNRFGDAAKPILATEITWPSSQGKAPPQFGVSTTEDQQAARLGTMMPLLEADRARLGLLGFYWYTWMGDEGRRAAPDAFDFAGLQKYVSGTVTAKPALSVFKRWALTIEGCSAKSAADTCAPH